MCFLFDFCCKYTIEENNVDHLRVTEEQYKLIRHNTDLKLRKNHKINKEEGKKTVNHYQFSHI
jgi:hypothetical protein